VRPATIFTWFRQLGKKEHAQTNFPEDDADVGARRRSQICPCC
jgi:hypothetical protein